MDIIGNYPGGLRDAIKGRTEFRDDTVKPLPGFERYAHVGRFVRPNRHLAEATKTEKPLDAYNDTLPVGCTLHPTKGYRARSERSVNADYATAEAKRDLGAWYRLWHPAMKVAA